MILSNYELINAILLILILIVSGFNLFILFVIGLSNKLSSRKAVAYFKANEKRDAKK